MIGKRKPKPKSEPEYTYSDEYHACPYLDCAIRRLKGEDAPHPDGDGGKFVPTPLPIVKPMPHPEAAIIRLDGEHNHILYVRWTPRRNSDQGRWRAIARFVERKLGSHTAIVAHKALEELSVHELAALESAFDRPFDHGQVKREAEPVTLDDAFYVTSARRGSWRPCIVYKGLRFSLCAPISLDWSHAPMSTDYRGLAPNLAIV